MRCCVPKRPTLGLVPKTITHPVLFYKISMYYCLLIYEIICLLKTILYNVYVACLLTHSQLSLTKFHSLLAKGKTNKLEYIFKTIQTAKET